MEQMTHMRFLFSSNSADLMAPAYCPVFSPVESAIIPTIASSPPICLTFSTILMAMCLPFLTASSPSSFVYSKWPKRDPFFPAVITKKLLISGLRWKMFWWGYNTSASKLRGSGSWVIYCPVNTNRDEWWPVRGAHFNKWKWPIRGTNINKWLKSYASILTIDPVVSGGHCTRAIVRFKPNSES